MAEGKSAGQQTSEFKLTVWVVILGTVLDAVAVAVGTLQQQGVESKWLAGAMLVAGTGMMLVKALGYTRSRTMLKLAEMAPTATQAVRDEVVPLAQTLRALVSELQAAGKGTPPELPPVTPPRNP